MNPVPSLHVADPPVLLLLEVNTLKGFIQEVKFFSNSTYRDPCLL